MSLLLRFACSALLVRISRACAVTAAITVGGFAAEGSSPRASQTPASSAKNRTVAEIQAAYDKTHATLEGRHRSEMSDLEKQIREIQEKVRKLKEMQEKLVATAAKIAELIPKLEQAMKSDSQYKEVQQLKDRRKTLAKEIQDGQEKWAELQKKLAVANREKDTLMARFQDSVARLRQEREQALKGAQR